MSEVVLRLRVQVDDAQVEKFNAKRRRLGRQARTPTEEVLNVVLDSLRGNHMFGQPVEVTSVERRDDEELRHDGR